MKRRDPPLGANSQETDTDPEGDFLPLGEARQRAASRSGWAIEGDCDPAILRSSAAIPSSNGRRALGAEDLSEIDRAAGRCRRGATEDLKDNVSSIDCLSFGSFLGAVATKRRSVSGAAPNMVDCIQLLLTPSRFFRICHRVESRACVEVCC